jgi:hypothetical protein
VDVTSIGANCLVDEIEVYTDGTDPVVFIDPPDRTAVATSATVTFPVAVLGGTANLTSGDVTINHNGTSGGTVTIVDGATASPQVQVTGITGTGDFTISIGAGIATDGAGNTSAAAGNSLAVTADNTAPTVTVDSLVTSSTTPTLTGTADDASGIVGVEVTVNSVDYTATVDTSVSPATWSVDVTDPLPGGFYNVIAIATDGAGNSGADATTAELEVDNSDPVFNNVAVDPAVASEGTLVTISFKASEELTANPTVTVNGEAATFVSATPDGSGGFDYVYTFTVPEGAGAGDATIEISGEDLLGFTGSTTNTTALDTLPPLPVAAWPAALALLAAGAWVVRRRRR